MAFNVSILRKLFPEYPNCWKPFRFTAAEDCLKLFDRLKEKGIPPEMAIGICVPCALGLFHTFFYFVETNKILGNLACTWLYVPTVHLSPIEGFGVMQVRCSYAHTLPSNSLAPIADVIFLLPSIMFKICFALLDSTECLVSSVHFNVPCDCAQFSWENIYNHGEATFYQNPAGNGECRQKV